MNAHWKSQIGMVLLAVAALVASAPPAAAQYQSFYQRVKGVELLPQFLHPQGAVFAYDLLNQRNRKTGFGYVVVDHNEQLPSSTNPFVPVDGGEFMYVLGWRYTSGRIWFGEISATGDPDVYDVYLVMRTFRGEWLCFEGELDHRPLYRFPPSVPTVEGELRNCFLPAAAPQ